MPGSRECCGSLESVFSFWSGGCHALMPKECFKKNNNNIGLTFFSLKSVVGNIHSIKAASAEISLFIRSLMAFPDTVKEHQHSKHSD